LFEDWKGVLTPNPVMYSTLAKGFASARQPDGAMELWRDMRSRGVRMNTVMCNAIIDAQARCGAMDAVSQIVEVMEQENCKPDVITFSTMIKGYGVKGDLDKALEVFRSIQKRGLVTDAIIYNTLLDGCLRHNCMDLAYSLAEEMEHKNVVPSNFTLGVLVKMYARRHELDKAFSVAESLSRRHGFAMNAQVKTSLISACINNHAIDRALEVFAELRRAGPDFKAYGVLISGCVRFGRLTKAVDLVEDAYGLADGRRGLPPGESLEKDRLEQLLSSLKAKGLMETVGVPLLDKLRSAQEPIASRIILTSSRCDRNCSEAASGGRRKCV